MFQEASIALDFHITPHNALQEQLSLPKLSQSIPASPNDPSCFHLRIPQQMGEDKDSAKR